VPLVVSGIINEAGVASVSNRRVICGQWARYRHYRRRPAEWL